MEDDFESQYADELDAMEDLEPPESMSPRPKRSLNFTSPKQNSLTASRNTDLNTSGFSPLKTPSGLSHGSLNGRTKHGVSEDVFSNSPLLSGLSKKRARDEEFGGLSDSELEYEEEEEFPDIAPRSKKSRVSTDGMQEKNTTSQENLPSGTPEIVNKIIQHRRRHQRPGVYRHTLDEHGTEEDYDFERRRVHKRIPSGDFICTTGPEGERVYMHLKDELVFEREVKCVDKGIKESTSLLRVSVADLREQLEEERRNRLLAESQQLTAEVRRQLDDDQGFVDDIDDDTDDMCIDKENLEPSDPSVPQKLLWVEKYAPRRYTDLLSEESINRTLLHWLKLWDYVVFGKELKVTQAKDKKTKDSNKNFNKKFQPEVLEELDKLKRPLQKVALLCGPPGLGKTTLAHVIARHAGYNVVEMNASDDRSAEVFKNKIESATQMKAVLGADPRPNCLIIDEIDGAPTAAINILLNLTKKVDTAPASTKKKKEGGTLLRPVICICNDQFVPSLRQLRHNALILKFQPTEATKLAGRLYEVVRLEQLKSDMNTLMALCEKTDNDIRSCLNTLQFIQRHCKELSLRSINSMNVGQKDSNKSLFSVWYEILSLPRAKRNRFLSIKDIASSDLPLNSNSPTARFQNILSLAQATGEYDKLTQGLFENYLECKFKDPHMDGVCLANEWLGFTDIVNEFILHSQDYRLMPYLPYLPVTFHFLFAANVPPKVQYPHVQYEAFMKSSKCMNLVNTMMVDMIPRVRKFLDVNTTVLEILPPLMDIIQPNFRPVNTQLYSAREKEELAQLIRIMIAYNMTYHQEKTPEGQYTYILEPHVDEVVRFPNMKQHRQLTYAAKQMVAREVELEKLRQSEACRNPEEHTSPDDRQDEKTKKTGPAIPNHMQKLQAKNIKEDDSIHVVRDFFGREIKKKTPEAKKTPVEEEEEPQKRNVLATDLWFHFKEGSSNAIRRNVKVQDFL